MSSELHSILSRLRQFQADLWFTNGDKAASLGFIIEDFEKVCLKCGAGLVTAEVPAVELSYTGGDIIEHETTDWVEVCPNGCSHYELVTGESLPKDDDFEMDYIPF